MDEGGGCLQIYVNYICNICKYMKVSWAEHSKTLGQISIQNEARPVAEADRSIILGRRSKREYRRSEIQIQIQMQIQIQIQTKGQTQNKAPLVAKPDLRVADYPAMSFFFVC